MVGDSLLVGTRGASPVGVYLLMAALTVARPPNDRNALVRVLTPCVVCRTKKKAQPSREPRSVLLVAVEIVRCHRLAWATAVKGDVYLECDCVCIQQYWPSSSSPCTAVPAFL